jgi:cell division protein FtsN
MNRLFLFLAIVALLFSGCKMFKKTTQAESGQATETAAETKVFTVPTNETVTETPPPAPGADEKPVAMRSEQVSFTSQEDRTENEANTYFVILGSFSQLDNAKNYRTQLLDEGFTPIILHSETGYYRVCVNSYKNETDARSRVAQVRQAFPKYSDVWLLIKE